MKIAYDTACAQWAEQLALHLDDLSSTDRRALEACLACQAVREEYGVMADQIQTLPDPMLAGSAPRWLAYAQRESTAPFQRLWSVKRWLVAFVFALAAWLPLFPSWDTRHRIASKRQEYTSPLRKALLVPVPFCLVLAVSALGWQLWQLAGPWLLGMLCALLAYPGIALPLFFRLLLPIRFRPLLTLKQRLVGIPALLVTASCAGASWLALTNQSGTHLSRWEVEPHQHDLSRACLRLAPVPTATIQLTSTTVRGAPA